MSGVVGLWILWAAAAVRGHYDADDVNALRGELNSLMDAQWPPIARSFAGRDSMAARPGVGGSPGAARLIDGFFHRPAVVRPSTVDFVTFQSMDADAEDAEDADAQDVGDGDGSAADARGAAVMVADARGASMTTVDALDAAMVTADARGAAMVTADARGAAMVTAASTVFSTEDECVAATSAARGDGRWLCVCYTTDYLDWVGQRLDEASGGGDAADGLFECQYYKAVAKVLTVRPEDARPGDDDGGQRTSAVAPPPPPSTADEGSAGTRVDFDLVAGYRLVRSADDHFSVHYGLVGSDVQVRCSDDPGKNMIKWKYQKLDRKTKSTIINTDSNELSIMGMEPADSKNYTCSLKMAAEENAKKVKSDSYTHYIIAVEKPIYEIRGNATYKTDGIKICTYEMTGLMQKQLPALLRAEVCPEGSTRYACNVVIETASCTKNEKTLEIDYSMTLNDNANVFSRIRTSKKGRNALYYQQIVATISNVLATNLKKTLSGALIVSKFTLEETQFEPDHEQMKINTFVSCVPGFGLREVFCAACPPHHYSSDRSTECLKCPKNFHQPVAGSDKCVKCPTPFASGCFVNEVLTSSNNNYYMIGAITFIISFVILGIYFYCCRKQNKKKSLSNIRQFTSSVKRRFKLFEKKDLLPRFSSKKSIISKGKKVGKSLLKLVKKPKQKIIQPAVPFEIIHGKMGPDQIQNKKI